MSKGDTLSNSAAKARIDEKTARKYLNSEYLPSEMSSPHTGRTREDPFAAIWEKVRQELEVNPGRFSDGQRVFLQVLRKPEQGVAEYAAPNVSRLREEYEPWWWTDLIPASGRCCRTLTRKSVVEKRLKAEQRPDQGVKTACRCGSTSKS